MKYLYMAALVLSFLTELLASSSLILGPEGISAAGTGEQWSMHYGFAALAIASLSVWAWPKRSDPAVITVALGVLLVFHTGLLVSLTLAGDQPVGMVLHGVLSAMCVVLFAGKKHIA